jgi:DNA-binding transcriptional ArsR family regulator
MRQFMAIAKALADESRVRLLMFLRGGELCVCQIIEMLGLAPSTVSKHLSVLQRAGLVEGRKEGRWIYYRVADQAALARTATDWMHKCLENDSVVLHDAERLARVLKMDMKLLCARYSSQTVRRRSLRRKKRESHR